MSANERQVGGDHYAAPDGEQHWDRVWRMKLDYFQAQITKYVERCWKKNGLQDLLKAQHVLQKYIELSSPPAKFEPTHRHAAGGLYRVLDERLQLHLPTPSSDGFTWTAAVRYRDEAGNEFVRAAADFQGRFTALDGSEPGRGYVDQDR